MAAFLVPRTSNKVGGSRHAAAAASQPTPPGPTSAARCDFLCSFLSYSASSQVLYREHLVCMAWLCTQSLPFFFSFFFFFFFFLLGKVCRTGCWFRWAFRGLASHQGKSFSLRITTLSGLPEFSVTFLNLHFVGKSYGVTSDCGHLRQRRSWSRRVWNIRGTCSPIFWCEGTTSAT